IKMSHPNTTRRKHVLKEMMEDDYSLPTEQQQIVRVISSRGNNLHEVEPTSLDAENFLGKHNSNKCKLLSLIYTYVFIVSMPNKFRKNVWVKRGDFILVEPIEEGDKVKAEICKILTPEHIKEYTKAGIWPERFAKKAVEPPTNNASDSDSDESLPPNTNRPSHKQLEEDEDSETDSEDG
ncbi:hypothetical protein KR093_007227, partial [Drosophila rubida]